MARVQVFDENNVVVDLNSVQPWDGEGFAITPGDYTFEVKTVLQTVSKQNKPQLKMELGVIAGEVTEAHNGATMRHWISLSPKAAPRLRAFMDAIGITADAEGGFDDQDFVGRQFIAEVYEDQYQKGVNLETGEPIMKTTSKIRKERMLEGSQQAGAPQPTPAAKAAPSPRPSLGTPPARPTVPMLPRVTGVIPRPGQRVPLPGAKR